MKTQQNQALSKKQVCLGCIPAMQKNMNSALEKVGCRSYL
jgi:hypothetical protein